jgi:preprotein translocase subunit SecD
MRYVIVFMVGLFLLIGCGQKQGTEITTMPGGKLPADFLEMKDRMTGEVMYLEKEPVLDQTSIQSASVFHDEFSPNTGYNVHVEFDEAGAKEFARLTESSIGKRIAIVYDGQIMTAPFVNEKIPAGKAVVSNGNLSKEEAEAISKALNSGSGDGKFGFYRVLEQEY